MCWLPALNALEYVNCREGMGREEAEQLVKEAVALAMSRDGSSGGVIRIVTVHAGGADRSLVLPQVQEMICAHQSKLPSTSQWCMSAVAHHKRDNGPCPAPSCPSKSTGPYIRHSEDLCSCAGHPADVG